MKRLHLFLATGLLLAGCSKREEIETKCAYTFSNKTTRSITLDFYSSKADYNQNSNRLSRDELEPGDDLLLTLDVGHPYYLDWYSDYYTVNNWTVESLADASAGPFPQPELKTATGRQQINIQEQRNDTARSVLIGNGYQSVWQGEYPSNSAVKGIHTFLFRKDFTGRHVFEQNGDTVYSEDITYRVLGADRQFRMRISNKTDFVRTVAFEAVPYHTLSRDTLLVVSQDDAGSPVYYPLVRQ